MTYFKVKDNKAGVYVYEAVYLCLTTRLALHARGCREVELPLHPLLYDSALLYDLHPAEESEISSFRPRRRNCLHLKCNAVTLHAKMLLLPDTMAAAL